MGAIMRYLLDDIAEFLWMIWDGLVDAAFYLFLIVVGVLALFIAVCIGIIVGAVAWTILTGDDILQGLPLW